ncbi:MAG: hypothetical protein ACREOD_04565 [Candidatus Dormibacteria bacterium]
MSWAPPLAATGSPSGGTGLGIVILAVGVLMAGAAAITLRSIWGRQPPPPEPGQRPEPGQPRPLRSPAVGEIRRGFGVLLSFDFGCLALMSAVLIFLGLVVIFRAL